MCKMQMNKIALILFFLAYCARAADDLPNDPSSLRILVEQGSHEAMTKLGYFYFTGNQVEKSYEQAASLYMRAAEKGNLWAMNNLCNMHLYGEGVEKNLSLAFHFCREPARAGNSSSMVMIAEIVLNLEERPFSEDKELAEKTAFQFYEMAATRKHVHGQYMLGLFYENGRGVPENVEIAKEWYEKAAAQGHEEASVALRQLSKSHNKQLQPNTKASAE